MASIKFVLPVARTTMLTQILSICLFRRKRLLPKHGTVENRTLGTSCVAGAIRRSTGPPYCQGKAGVEARSSPPRPHTASELPEPRQRWLHALRSRQPAVRRSRPAS